VDPLTQVVELLRPRSFLGKQLVGRGSWEWRFPAMRGVVFGRVVTGRCRFEVPELGEHTAGQGDYLLLTNPEPWTLRGGDGPATPVDFDTAYAAMGTDDLVVGEHLDQEEDESTDPDTTRIVAGHFEFDPVNAGLLASLLSPVVYLPAVGRSDRDLLCRTLVMIDTETAGERPGRDAVLSRLLEIMLVELLRTPQLAASRRSLLNGLTDPQIAAALRAFHADIQKPWSVASLAAQANLSRSAFSDRFAATVGQPPMTYALNWRMAVARDALAAGGNTVEQVAAMVGYGSASAFSTAFVRTVGISPARYARARGSGTVLPDSDDELFG